MSATLEAPAPAVSNAPTIVRAGCTVCAHPKCADINAAVASGETARSAAARFECSESALYRHLRSGHHRGKPDTPPDANGLANAPPMDDDDRDAENLVRAARRHLRRAMRSAEDKDRNGAIQAACKALEHRAKLRGKLQNGPSINVTATASSQAAAAAHSQAEAMSADEVTAEAGAWLHAQLEAGSAEAVRTVHRLMRMLPSAEVASTGALDQLEHGAQAGDAPGAEEHGGSTEAGTGAASHAHAPVPAAGA